MIEIVDEAPWHVAAREDLLDLVFGPSRFEKPSERLREGRLPVIALSAVRDGELVATVRLWRAETGDGRAVLLLGPLAVLPELQGSGLGGRLMRQALNRASVAGHEAVVLVGDAAYYGRFGFSATLTGALDMPGAFARDRLLALELVDGSLAGARGELRAGAMLETAPWRPVEPSRPVLGPWPPLR